METNLNIHTFVIRRLVVSLPMRDGNTIVTVLIKQQPHVVSLPMRDGNSSSVNSPVFSSHVVSLPMRDGNPGGGRRTEPWRMLLAYL